MSQEGYDRIAAEIEHLKTVGRQEASRAIAEAREKGDLSENAEYHAAKDAQGMLEMKINELDKKMMNVRIIDENLIDTSIVSILTNVIIKNQHICIYMNCCTVLCILDFLLNLSNNGEILLSIH